MGRIREAAQRCIRLRWTGAICLIVSVLVIGSNANAATVKKHQATPAQGDNSDQPVDVNTPYCDAYLPYTFVAKSKAITPVFPHVALPAAPSDDEINRFLDRRETTSDPIFADGSFSDPGYPIFGNPKNKLYADGSDLSRLLKRLFAVNQSTGEPLAVPMCGPPAPSAADKPDPSTKYYLVHIVHWKRVRGAYQTDSSDWYVFNQNDKKAAHREFPFTFHPLVSGDLRMFGSQKIFFLAIHLAPTGDYTNFSQQLKISYKLKVTKIEPANIQDLKALIGVVIGSGGAAASAAVANKDLQAYKAFLSTFSPQPRRPYDGLYGAARLTNLENLPVQITSTMNATLPKADATLADASVHQEAGFWDDLTTGAPVATPAAAATPSGCSTSSTSGTTGTCSENVVVQNEGLYWWDVSIGIPFKGISQLQFNSTSTGQVTPKTVSKSSAYGFLVLAPWKEDIVSPPSLGIPHVLIGVPLSGKVFNSPFVGLGETFNLSKLPGIGTKLSKIVPFGIRFYAGLVENKQFGPPPSSGNSATPYRWIGHLQYGIEFSVRDIANKLSAAKSSKSSTSSKQ